MVRVLQIFFVWMCLFSYASAQTLDYFRDLYFYKPLLRPVKDAYYKYSPLLNIVQGYAGKGLKVLVIQASENTGQPPSFLIGKVSIEAEIDYIIDRPYLRELRMIDASTSFSIVEYAPDVIIMDERALVKYPDLPWLYSNRVMLYNGNMTEPVIALKHPAVRVNWHFNYRLTNIAQELIKIWHTKDAFRGQTLGIERAKNFVLKSHARGGVVLIFSLLVIIALVGFKVRLKRVGYGYLFYFAVLPLVMLFVLGFYYEYDQVQQYAKQVRVLRHQKRLVARDLLDQMDKGDALQKCIVLRGLLERYKDNALDPIFVDDHKILYECLLPYTHDADERVRMFSVNLLGNMGEATYLEQLYRQDWHLENSYLVRSRVVRILGNLDGLEAENALLVFKEFEKHPYVYYEVRERGVLREFWQAPQSD